MMQACVGFIIVAALTNYVTGMSFTGMITFQTPVDFLIALTLTIYGADLIRHGVVIARYRIV